ncbi:MAG TPA: GNAT family N-acetyltransferase [Ignavibacteria bacterium]
MNYSIRKAIRSDSKEIINLINELAHFEKLTPPGNAASRRLINEAFSRNPRFRILVAEYEKKIIAYAFYFFSYSTFLAKPTLYLEDIYISKNFRSKGLGKSFFTELKKIAKKEKCGRIEWVVLDWNKNAINFYEKLGAKKMKEWIFFRLSL